MNVIVDVSEKITLNSCMRKWSDANAEEPRSNTLSLLELPELEVDMASKITSASSKAQFQFSQQTFKQVEGHDMSLKQNDQHLNLLDVINPT